jgi:hypothetical protein
VTTAAIERKGIRRFLRDFTAIAVGEHLRSAIEATGGSPDLTKNEIELVRFISEGAFDWRVFLAEQNSGAPQAQGASTEQRAI